MLALKVCHHLPIEELKVLYKKTKKNKVARKYLAILKLYEGKSPRQVAGELFVTPQIVRKWIHKWNELGPKGLVDIPQSGRPPFLTAKEQAEVIQDLLKSPGESGFDYSNWMLKLMVEHVKRKYGVEITQSGIWRMLKRHNVTRLVPRPLPAKADPEKNKNFLRKRSK